jgi:WD40 repeat protein
MKRALIVPSVVTTDVTATDWTMKRAFLFFAVAILFCNTTLAQEPDPDPNLIWKTENSYLRFLVHPNGNILAGAGILVEEGSKEFELDGNTGTIIRGFDSPVVFFDVSPDGKYISANDKNNWKCVIDYETGEVIQQFTNLHTKPKFMPDSRTLVYFVNEPISGLKGNLKLQSYNIDTKKYKSSANLIHNTTSETIAISPDGRYVATSGRNFDNDEDGYTELILWDAETLAPIKYLKEFESYQPVRSIKFSPDSRLVGFSLNIEHLYIYDTENFSLYKYDDSVFGFGFISNDFLAIGGGTLKPLVFQIINLVNNEIIYTKNNFSGYPEHNKTNNSIIVLYGYIDCYYFEKILSGASIKLEIPNPFTVEYLTNTLFIKNYNFTSVQLSVQITDINGRVIRNMNLTTAMNEIRIPLKLISGTYFLHIKDGSKEYVDKFLVVE